MRSYLLSCILLLTPLLLLGQAPKAYNHLGLALDKQVPVFKDLCQDLRFQRHNEKFKNYFNELEQSFTLGYMLDDEIDKLGDDEKRLSGAYLNSLRSLKGKEESLREIYFKEVKTSIEKEEERYFLFLIDKGKELLAKNAKLKADVLLYTQEIKTLQQNPLVKELQAEKELDERSYAFTQKMQDEYRAYQEVLKKEQALKLRQLLISKKEGGVIVYATEDKGDIHFIMENLFEMHVSTTLFIQKLQGYETQILLPYKTVLQAKEKKEVLTLYNTDKKKKVGSFSSHISYSKGSVEAKEDKDFIYALPFHKSQKVSQGFNGNTSHKGNAKYAVDFAMDIGTEVYASRAGRVVEIVQHHNQHGIGKEMRKYANYVIIEHSDKTLGRYFHLKQNSVKLHLADEVKQGELIGLSGNTGRTSGPHLHFVVTKAEAFRTGYRSVSIPIKFQCLEGIVDKPLNGHHYYSVLK